MNPPPYLLRFTREAAAVLSDLTKDERKLHKVRRALGRLETNPRHPGLNSHPYRSLHGIGGETVWDSYIENHTPSAWRIFWHYGPEPRTIT
ncbi:MULTISPECIES: hypothetical protein, partial [unclassified Frankia]|uniref:hypothetical protein n=1 Tax=unclassified Frankia TaxID=2632575 RepID=UPI002AD32863